MNAKNDHGQPENTGELLELLKRAANISSTGIHVVDLHTWELYYCNDACFRFSGQEPREYRGQCCYKALFGLDKPCASCRLEQTIAGVTWHQVHFEGTDRVYLSNTEISSWNGKQVLVEYFTDITEKSRAEEGQKRLLSQLEMAAEQAGIWFWSYDWQTDIGYMSRRMQRDFHVPERMEHFIESWLATGLTQGMDAKTYRKLIDRLKAGEASVTAECVGHKGDGIMHSIQIMLRRPMEDEKDDSIVIGTARVIDDLKDLQKKYELEHKRTQDDKSLIAFAVFDLDNRRTLEMERRKPLLPLDGAMTLEAFRDDIADCIFDSVQRRRFETMFDPEYLVKCFMNGIHERNTEYQRTLPGGKVVWVKSSFRMVMDPNSKEILLFYYCNDTNLPKVLEIMTSFMVSEDYDVLGCINFHDSSAIALYGENSILRPEGNRRAICEEHYPQMLERFAQLAVVPEEREQYLAQATVEKIQEALSQSHSYEFVLHVLDRDGRRLTKKIRYIRYRQGAEICLFTQVDITQLLKEEEHKQQVLREALLEAKHANEAKTSFLSRMSHDMRTPMNGILGLAALSEGEQDPALLQENVRKIKESGDYLLSLINDTLDFQRIESGKLSLEKQVVYTRELLNGVLDIIRPTIQKKKLNFEVDDCGIEPDSYIRLDPVHFKQILINLLSNAVKFTPEGGTIAFELGCLSREEMLSHCYIRVSDTGIGMSREFMENSLFKPFSQESSAVMTEYAGSGLGLSIVKSLVELMGGRIEVESSLGKGTTFTVYLDFEVVSPEKARQKCRDDSRQRSHAEHNLTDKHILLAEDHPLNAEITKRLLMKVGCRVTWAANGQEGAELFEASAPGTFDAVLMDIRMPVMDGLTAAKRIRDCGHQQAGTIPMIAMSANAYAEDVEKSMQAGMNAHLAKPVEAQQLYKMLAKFVGDGRE